jgi:hypothetical protein
MYDAKAFLCSSVAILVVVGASVQVKTGGEGPRQRPWATTWDLWDGVNVVQKGKCQRADR